MGTMGRNLRRLLVATFATAALLTMATVSGAAAPISGVSNFQQCANGAPPSGATDCPSGWINSILQANNSHYAEDDVVPQRVVIDLADGSPLTNRSITLSYLTRKGGVHAYDSLATWNFTQTSADRCAGLSGADCVGGAASTIGVPSDPTVVADNGGGGSATSGHQLSGQVFTLYGGTLTGVSAYTHDDPGGTSDEFAHVTISYSVPSTTGGTKVMLLFGGHIAPGLGPRGWGPGLGAGSISGGPYHIKIDALDAGAGNVGSQDNQIMSSAILAPANIVIKKTAVGGDGTFGYTATGGISSSFSIATSGGSGTQAFTNITHGAYTVTESSLPAGWDFSNLVCSDPTSNSSVNLGTKTATINLDPGETVTCTYTNTKRGHIIVKKQTNPGGDPQQFTFTPSYNGGQTFPLADGQQNDSGLLVAGTYSVSEAVPAGWDQTSATCDDGSSPSSIGLQAGETVTCTFVNTKRAHLIVIKHVVNDNGGSAVASNWQMHVKSGGSDIAGSPFAGAESPGVSKEIVPGSYNVSETGGPAGYALTYSGDCNASGDVSVPAGQTKTCVLTNDDVAPQLTVIKHVVNDNGGSAVASNWQMHVKSGGSDISGSPFAGAESPGVTKSVSVGSYNVSETGGPSGYALSYSGDCDSSGNVTVALGQTKTCVLTNDDQAPGLTVIKHVVNDNGGSAVASQWQMHVKSGGTDIPGSPFAGAESPGVTKSVNAGTYNVSESGGPAQYTLSYSGDCDGQGNVTVGPGQSKTCVLTNDDNPAHLRLVKTVVNDNGGTAKPSDFTLSANGPTPISGTSPVSSNVNAGSYTLSETNLPGYTAGAWSCQFGGTFTAPNTISLGVGQSATCTVSNDDQPAHLIVKKVVVNDNGGTKVASDFSFQVNGGAATSFEADGQNDMTVNAGTYNVTEPGVSGYTTSYDDCSDIHLGVGETATCTITNDDNAAHLTLVKEVVNDNGGTAVAADWVVSASGPTPISGNGAANGDVDAGSYSLSESGGPDGYTAGDWSCDGGTQDGASVSLALGESATCTITNDDNPATLIVKKVVVNDNGGTKVASDFSFQVNGGAAQKFEADGQNDLSVDAGTYNVTEPGVAGYTTTYQGCDAIDLAVGETATCVITNNDVPKGVGSISVSKSADPTSMKEPGGPVQFSVRITNTSLDVDVVITNVVDDKFGDLDDDGGSGCFDVPITLHPGGSVSCQFTKQITGNGGTSHVDTVTASGHDQNGKPVSASDDARVDITPRLIDLVIQKDASSPTPLNGIVNYTMTVTNKGPDTATNVQLADPAPAGITYLSATASQGSCTATAALITCNLGSIAAGQSVTVHATARATTVGSHTNTATVTGGGGRETNPADNVDSAVTIVPAPIKPPTTKPQPKPQPCLALTVTPKMVKADGKTDRIVAKVTAGGKAVKGAKVLVQGAGVRKSGRTNAHGIVVLRVNPTKAGLITITTPETHRSCGPRRIGVVGVFLPPLTG